MGTGHGTTGSRGGSRVCFLLLEIASGDGFQRAHFPPRHTDQGETQGMFTATTHATSTAPRTLAAVLLARRGAVYLPAAPARPSLATTAGVALLEADLLDRGHLMAPALREALAASGEAALAAAGRALLADLDRALGADRPHVPLFRDFPASTPRDTFAFYVDRVLTLLFQHPEQPCVLCGTEGTVHAVSPCAHLVCRSCFDGADFSACPVCHRGIDADDPFLRPRRPRRFGGLRRALPGRLRVLQYGGDPAARDADAAYEIRGLLARTGAPGPQDADDLMALLDTRDRADLSWLPEKIPGRETKARVLAWLLADPAAYATGVPAVAARVDTATDVLRLLAVRSGGDPGLVDPPRLRTVPRPLRRALLGMLDGLAPDLVAQDMRRHRHAWLRAAELLHAFEHAGRFPRAALAVAALRDTRLADGDALTATLRTAADGAAQIDATGTTVRVRGWAGRVEAALDAMDVPAAVALLARRPGEFVRRLDHLLRLSEAAEADAVLSALETAVPRVSPAVLLSALGALRSRTHAAGTRVFFPKGGSAKAYLADDDRLPIAAGVVDRAVAVLRAEVLRRAAEREAVDVAVVDAVLDGLIAPFTERTASRALVTLPRGSELPVPEGRTIRLFLHWTESERSGRTDLDLSTALFDAEWNPVGHCDYTRLRFAEDAAVHSGDLTSAPAPRGASEFVDLDLDKLASAGVRHLVAVVFSYNNVPFEDLAEAFAGLMSRDEPGNTGPVFDARAVEQRYDLTGRARASVPLVIDVAARTMRWLDVVEGVTGTGHSVARHGNALAALGEGLTGLFSSGARVGLGELAVWQAAARAATVLLRHADGSTTAYRRREAESAAEFAARIGTPYGDPADGAMPEAARLAYLLRGDVAVPAGGEVFALHPGALDAAKVRLLSASDVVASLAPAEGVAATGG
ncbi:MXAN_6230/SCO0854 family RING domain-containing protein [Streptomyces sp. NPDC026673]|uniref:MXAN_6230/SCO0854 family RING domain-containing protein n=1 Tax=Streptomyces sp. NPDC026673 TaxID=3155724 RepID=UPI0033D28E81